ncbi:MAG: ROK family protein [Ilumatobacteraceae bacterium]
MTLAAGIDVGGTKILGVVLDERGQIVAQQRRPTPKGGDNVIQELVDLARDLGPYESLGVGVPGLVTRTGVLRAAPNLADAHELAVRPKLEEMLGHPVSVDNDATCAMLAEWHHGAARGFDDVVLVALGTGIGGGLVMGGVLQRGTNGFAGEIGHMVVQPDGLHCVCGRRGCWERYASGSGLQMLAGGVRGEDVIIAARSGDAESLAVIDTFARWVAIGLANLTNLLDPAAIVLGGGLAAAPDIFLGPIQREFGSLLYAPKHRPHPHLAFAELGEHAGAIGAALLPTIHA